MEDIDLTKLSQYDAAAWTEGSTAETPVKTEAETWQQPTWDDFLSMFEDASWGDWTQTETKADTSEQMPWEGEWSDNQWQTIEESPDIPDDIMELVDRLISDTGSEKVDEATDSLQQAVDTWDSAQISEELTNLKMQLANRDSEIKSLWKQIQMFTEQLDKANEEKLIAEFGNQQNNQIIKQLEDNPDFKALLVYSRKKDGDPKSQEKYVDTLRSLYEQATWTDLKELAKKANESEASQMAWLWMWESPVWTAWAWNSWISIGWMQFENA